MRDTTVRHNWCEICTTSTDNHSDHEATAVSVNGVTGAQNRVTVQANYLDGTDEPLLWIDAASVNLTAAGVDELIATLQKQRQIMASVVPTPELAGMLVTA